MDPRPPSPTHDDDPSYFVLLALLNVGSQGLQGLLAATGRQVGAELGATPAFNEGHAQVAFLVVYAVFTPLGAVFAGRISRRRLLILGTAWWASCCALATQAQDLAIFTALFAAAAAGNACILPTTQALAVDVVAPERRGRAFAWLSVASTYSIGLSFMIGGFCVESLGWRFAFRAFTVFGAVSLLALLLWKRYEPSPGAHDRELNELHARGQSYDDRLRVRDLFLVLRPRSNAWILLAVVLSMAPVGAVGFFFVNMLQRDHALAAPQATLCFLVLYTLQLPGQLLLGRLSDRAGGPRGILRLLAGFTLATVPCYMIAYLTPWDASDAFTAAPGFVLFATFAMLGALASCPLVQWTLQAVGELNSPERRGVLFSLVNLGRLAGRSLGILFVLALARGPDAAGPGSAEALVAISSGMGWSALFFVPSALLLIPAIRSATQDREALRERLEAYVRERVSEPAQEARPR